MWPLTSVIMATHKLDIHTYLTFLLYTCQDTMSSQYSPWKKIGFLQTWWEWSMVGTSGCTLDDLTYSNLTFDLLTLGFGSLSFCCEVTSQQVWIKFAQQFELAQNCARNIHLTLHHVTLDLSPHGNHIFWEYLTFPFYLWRCYVRSSFHLVTLKHKTHTHKQTHFYPFLSHGLPFTLGYPTWSNSPRVTTQENWQLPWQLLLRQLT